MDFDIDSISEDNAELHQLLIRMGEALRNNPKARNTYIRFLKAAFRVEGGYLSLVRDNQLLTDHVSDVEKTFPAPNMEEELKQQIRALQKEKEQSMKWLIPLGENQAFWDDYDWDVAFSDN